jgi:Cft2 family RNA processing exonuclease/predicted  nucleic acid-binding Zn-ribbon protein
VADEDSASDTPEEDPLLDSDIAEAILNLVTGGAVAEADSGAHSSSTALLAPAAYLAVGEIVRHGKHCHRKKTCPETPPPLRNLLTMREAGVSQQIALIARTLMQFPQFSMVQQVRDHWLSWVALQKPEDGGPSVIDLIDQGDVFTRDGLLRYLGEDPQPAAEILASTLWARGFSTRREQALFRLLGAIATSTDRDAAQPVAAPQPAAKRDRAARRAERREVQALETELKDVKRERRRVAEELAGEVKRREAAVVAMDAATNERDEDKATIESLERELRVARGRIATLARDLERSTASAQKLRGAMEGAETARQELEQARNRAVRELSLKNRQLDALRAEIAAIPTGADAVHHFLEAEEARIDQDLAILQGGDRAGAEEEHAAHRKLEQAFRAAYPSYVPPRPASLALKVDLELEILGGGDEVGRSSYALRLGDYTVLVDCGIKIGRKHLDEIVPDLTSLDRLDAVVLTHAHTDHLGWLPAIVRAFPDVSIYCTTETAELAPIMLDDCYRHHAVNMHRLRVERAHSADSTPIPETYDREDLAEVEFRLFGCEFGEPVTLPASEIQLRFLRSGHILGAASALIEGSGRRVLMSGDVSSEAQHTVGTADWAEVGDSALDLLVLESTYGGDATRVPLHQAQEQLVEFVKRTASDGGSVILPCFGLGRGQEVAMVLTRAMEAGDLPKVPVWIDGMIRSINRVYRDYQPQFQLSDNFIEVQASVERSEVVDRARREPVIIVTTSGMLSGGPAVEYAQRLLPEARHRIAFTGYQDEGQPGNELLRLTGGGTGARTVTVTGEEGEPVEIRAAAQAKQFGLSAHADQQGLLRLAASVRPEHIALVHGFAKTQQPLEARLNELLPGAKVALGSTRRLAVP